MAGMPLVTCAPGSRSHGPLLMPGQRPAAGRSGPARRTGNPSRPSSARHMAARTKAARTPLRPMAARTKAAQTPLRPMRTQSIRPPADQAPRPHGRLLEDHYRTGRAQELSARCACRGDSRRPAVAPGHVGCRARRWLKAANRSVASQAGFMPLVKGWICLAQAAR
jgi:hypothetical protein